MSIETNQFQGIINTKRALQTLADLAEAVATPIENKTIRHGNLSLNTVTGLLNYRDARFIILRKSTRTYPIIYTLITNGGNETTYAEFATALKSKDNDQLRLNVRTTIKDIRRRLKINSRNAPLENIFVATGSGYILGS